jgi:hypothetical protein
MVVSVLILSWTLSQALTKNSPEQVLTPVVRLNYNINQHLRSGKFHKTTTSPHENWKFFRHLGIYYDHRFPPCIDENGTLNE